MIWALRAALVVVLTLMVYVTLLPAYNFAPWIPDRILIQLDLPTSLIELLQTKADKIVHFFGAFTVIVLGFGAIVTPLRRPSGQSAIAAILILSLVALAAEYAQLQIGRQFSVEDILAGVLGGALAIMAMYIFTGNDRSKQATVGTKPRSPYTRP